jgi:glycosyltransferase involved in cell wall biosynthesis
VYRVLIEGLRFSHHSYALVAQSHALCLLQHADVDLRFSDLPFHHEATSGIFSPAQERALAMLCAPGPSFAPDATLTLRLEAPDFGAPPSGLKFVFGTPEYRILTEENRRGLQCAAEIADTVGVVTPSRWAALAYERFGMPAERIHVVPHGIEPAVLYPDEASRAMMRKALRLEDNFIYLSVGAMTWNKGPDILLSAFSRVIETEPYTRLFLKGADGLFPSKSFVREVLDDLPAKARQAVAERLIYEGRTLSGQGMGHLFRAADCYVAPYRAEGFNLPVLEAMACGVAVLCTAGGPTDEFTAPAFARRIRSTPLRKQLGERETGDALEPDLDHLIELMRDAARHPGSTREAGACAALHAGKDFTWDAVTDRLLGKLLPARALEAKHPSPPLAESL